MADVYGLSNLRTLEGRHRRLSTRARSATFDVTLMLGLLYHVENPVGALRLARALTRRACVIETQVTPNMTGVVDWGAYTFQRQMVGSFALIDETAETHAPEASDDRHLPVPELRGAAVRCCARSASRASSASRRPRARTSSSRAASA